MSTLERRVPREVIADSLRQVTMLEGEVRPYEHATISFEQVDFSEFRPTQLYVLRNCLVRQAQLHYALHEQGVDTFELDEGIVFGHEDESIAMIPPIVEHDAEHGLVLLDGTHRTFTARKLGRKSIGAIVIDGVPADLPIVSFPNEWHEMTEYDATPHDLSLKRRYRPEGGSHLYRDLSPLNGGGPREAGSVV